MSYGDNWKGTLTEWGGKKYTDNHAMIAKIVSELKSNDNSKQEMIQKAVLQFETRNDSEGVLRVFMKDKRGTGSAGEGDEGKNAKSASSGEEEWSLVQVA